MSCRRSGGIANRILVGHFQAVIRAADSAVFLITSLVTMHFGFEEEWQAAQEMYSEQQSG
jgi:hypothetical protein